MKPRLFFFAAAMFVAHLTTAQVLYTEDFESYNTGPFSTDLTGATPAQGGWYTWTNFNSTGTATVNDYKIVADPNKGNVLKIVEGRSFLSAGHYVYRTDLNTYWQQRTPGHNVLKLAFDLYTDSNITVSQPAYVSIYNKEELLVSFHYDFYFGFGSIGLANRGHTGPNNGTSSLLIKRRLPADSWVTIELYIDYDNDKVYFSVPSLNHTVAADTHFPLYLTGGGDHDDNPVKLELAGGYGYNSSNPVSTKIDNINLSAQNTVPTVSINEFVSNKFNVFPNPATNAVMIINNENIGVKEIAIYDVNRKIVKLQKGKNENEVILDIEDFASGTYFLHIVTDQGTGIKKLVKK